MPGRLARSASRPATVAGSTRLTAFRISPFLFPALFTVFTPKVSGVAARRSGSMRTAEATSWSAVVIREAASRSMALAQRLAASGEAWSAKASLASSSVGSVVRIRQASRRRGSLSQALSARLTSDRTCVQRPPTPAARTGSTSSTAAERASTGSSKPPASASRRSRTDATVPVRVAAGIGVRRRQAIRSAVSPAMAEALRVVSCFIVSSSLSGRS